MLRVRLVLFSMLAIAPLAACAGAHATDAGTPPADAPAARPPTLSTLAGVARDAKAGAMIVGTEAGDFYVEGLDAWPAEWNGRRVVVSGRIMERQGPACVHDREPCQGIAGAYRVLTDASYHLDD